MVIALLGFSKLTICSQNLRRGLEATVKGGFLGLDDRVLKGSAMTELWEQGFTEIGGRIVPIDDPSAQLSSSQQTVELKKAEADEESVETADKETIKGLMEKMNKMPLEDYREIPVEGRDEIVADLVTIAKRFSAGSKEADPEIETAVKNFVKEKFVDPLDNKKSTNYDLSEAQSALNAFGELPELKEMLQTAVDKYNSRSKVSFDDLWNEALKRSGLGQGKRDKSLKDFEDEARSNPNYLFEAKETVKNMVSKLSANDFQRVSPSERQETFDFLSVALTASFDKPRPGSKEPFFQLAPEFKQALTEFLTKLVLEPLKDGEITAVDLTKVRVELKAFARLTEVNKTFLDLLSERLKKEPNSAELKKVTVDFLEDNLVDSLTPKDGDPAASLDQFSQASEALKQLKDLIESPEFAGRDVAEKFKKAVKDAIEKNPRMKEKLQQILDDFEKTFPSKDAPSLTASHSASVTLPDEGNESGGEDDDGEDDDGDDIPRDILLESYAENYVSEIIEAKDAGAAEIGRTTRNVIKRIKDNQDLQPDEIAALLTQITTILDIENTVAADDENGDGEEPFRGALMLLKKASGSAPERDPAALLSRTEFTKVLNTELSEEDVSKAEKKAIDYDIRDYLENAKAIESKGFFKTFGRFIRRSVGHLMEHRKIKKIIDEGEGAVEEYIKAKANETPPNMDDIADMINTVSKYDRYPDHYIENFIKIALTEGTKQNLQEVKRRGLELLKELKGSTAAGQRFEGSASGSLTSHIANLVLDVHREMTAAENADASGGDAGGLFGDGSGKPLTEEEQRKRAEEAQARAKEQGKTAAGDSAADRHQNVTRADGVQETPQHEASGGQDDPSGDGPSAGKATPKANKDDPTNGPSAGELANERKKDGQDDPNDGGTTGGDQDNTNGDGEVTTGGE